MGSTPVSSGVTIKTVSPWQWRATNASGNGSR
jgi:hypothetical protein